MAHPHSVYDTDFHFIIDPVTRLITNTSDKCKIMQYDHNSERFTFECPRFVEGHDMSTCGKIEVHYTNKSAQTEEENPGLYTVLDMQLSPVSDDTIIFSWLISGGATQLAGKLWFSIRFVCLIEGNVLDYIWSTDIFKGIKVSPNFCNTHEVVEKYIDELAPYQGASDEAIYRAVKEYLDENPIDTDIQLETDDTLTLENNLLSVNTADTVEEGNKLPVTSDAVKRAIDGIEIPEIDTFDAEKVCFSADLTTTTAIGNITLNNGQATIPAKGKNLKQVWDSIFVKESNPSTTDPSVSLTFSQAKAYEVGTKVTPSYSASLNPGSYTYGPDTGVAASAWSVTDTAGNTAKTTPSGSFPQFTVSDGTSYKITAKATHNAGAIPLTNVGNPYSAGQIKAGTKETTSSAVTGYRNTFYGTVTNKNALTSSTIRSLTKSGKALANGSTFTVTVPVGALRVVIAYPETLRDVTSIKDVNASSAEIKSGFKKSTLNVEGTGSYTAISYKVYTLDFANANDTANKFTVQI